jgi:putative tryptophan/tyrosine transport system substrate-binding protein
MVRLAMTDSQAKPAAKVSPLKGPMTPVDRRALLTALGGAAIATMAQPLSAHAQARQPMRRIGVLTWWSEYDPEGQSQAVALAQGLAKLGWTEGVNVKIEYRRVFGESERIDSYATQLVNHQPDLLVGVATPAVTALLRATRTIPVVFTEVSDPIGSGFVQTLARPGGNATGFVDIEASIGGKWVELLKQISPALKRSGSCSTPKPRQEPALTICLRSKPPPVHLVLNRWKLQFVIPPTLSPRSRDWRNRAA